MKKINYLIALCILFGTQLQAQLQFTDVAAATGCDYSYGPSMFGGGVSFADFDHDGWDDVTISTDESKKIYFFKNNGGTFSQVVLQGIDDQSRAKHVIWVDYDNDGDRDLFITNIVGKNRLYRNDGSMQFTDITDTCGIFTQDLQTTGATFGDIDNDGDLDLFIANWEADPLPEERNYLYRNDNGTFVDVTASNGIDLFHELSLGATFLDIDNDGDQDLYMINDRNIYQNRMFRNDGTGHFTEISASSNTNVSINAMSTGIGDYNADGFVDIYVTNTPEGNRLFKNNGNTTFTDVAVASGTVFHSFGWGAVFLDADNDTNLDLYVSGPFDGTVSSLLPSAFYHNQGDETFVIPDNIGLEDDTLQSFSNAIGDYNNDGKPDILVMNDSDPIFLWGNTSTNSNNWLKVKLEGVVSNKDGIGNRIEIHANGKSQYRFTVCGESYLGQNSFTEFFGIGDATEIDYVKVTWSATGQVETINNVQPNQSITIQEGNGILSTQSQSLIQFMIYPNPSDSGIYNIRPSESSDAVVKVFNLQGKELVHHKVENSQIDLSLLSSGIYILQLTSEKGTHTQKIIKN